MTQIPTQHVARLIAMERRAQTIAEAGGLEAALAGGTLPNPIDTTLAEGLVLGLLKQGVRKYLAVFGHGSTDLAEVLRVYEAAGLTRTYNFRHETAMAHAATALKWHYSRAAGHSPAGHRRPHLPHCSRDRADGGAMSRLHSLRHAGAQRWLIVPRLIAAFPLAVFGLFHLTGMSPLMQILERAGIPFPSINFYLAPLVMVIAGVSLGAGFYARVGAILGATAMVVAAFSKLVIEEWPGSVEPPLALPIVVFAACGTVLWLGAGAWSADRRATEPSEPGDRR
ncbi:MAG TPA: DoxX family protein [Vicinamibacteria bacterium]